MSARFPLRLLLSTPVLLTLLACGGLGTSAGPSAGLVSIDLSPVAATIPVDSSLAIHASGNLPKYTNVAWTVVEAEQAGMNCTTAATPPEPPPVPAAPCPFGWVGVPILTGFIAGSDATYHAPTVAGTYHVRAVAELNQSLASSVSTITVAAP